MLIAPKTEAEYEKHTKDGFIAINIIDVKNNISILQFSLKTTPHKFKITLPIIPPNTPKTN